MSIIELTEKDIAFYKGFFLSGLSDNSFSFRISVRNEEKEEFPTTGGPLSFTLGYTDHLGMLRGVVSFKTDVPNREFLAHKGLLFRMCVAKQSLRLGIGKKLINRLLEKVSRDTSIRQINLTVLATNVQAKNLYEKFGFKSFSYEQNALCINNKYYDEETMVLSVHRP